MRKEVIVHQDPKSPISEVFRTLRTNIQFMNTKGKLRTILVTSTLPGEGKSWVSSNLAVTFAQAGKKVVLIDADMRKGRQYSIFGVSPRPGLSNYLSGVNIDESEEQTEDLADYIQETEVENLYVIAAGNIPPNPSELLIAPQMVDLLEQLKEICDIIIIDGTPSQLVTDSLILTRLVDSTLIVTASKQTKKEDLKRVINNIQNVGGKIAGVVVNKLPISAKKYEQSYYYGSTSTGKMKTPNKKASRNGYNRAASMVGTKGNIPKTKTAPSTRSNATRNMAKPNLTRTEAKPKANEMPKALQNDLKVDGKDEISLEKTNDILKQINEYLDQEKKKLN